MDRERNIRSLEGLMNVIDRSRKMYEMTINNRSDVHQFHNKYQTALSIIQLSIIKINSNCSEKVIEKLIQECRYLVNDLVMFVGRKSRY